MFSNDIDTVREELNILLNHMELFMDDKKIKYDK